MDVNIIMVLNWGMYFATFLRSQKHHGLTVSSFLWFVYSLFAVFSIYLCASGLYWRVVQTNSMEFATLSPIPFLMNYMCVYILLMPLQKIRFINFDVFRFKYSKTNYSFIIALLLIEFTYSVMKLNQFGIALSYGLGNFHDLGGDLQNTIYYGENPILLLINYLGRFCHAIIMPFIMIYIVNGALCRKISKSFLALFIIIYIVNTFVVGLTTGSRAELFFSILNVSFFVILFWDKISKKIRSQIFIGGGIFCSAIVFFTSQITEERFSDGAITPIESVYRYLGETFPNLGYEYWDRANYTEGKRLFPDWYTFFDSNFRSRDADYWCYYTKTRVDYFKTLYGDLYVEFGPIVPFFLILFISLLMTKYIRGKTIGTEKIGLIYWYYSICTGGIFGFLHLSSFQDYLIIVVALCVTKVLKMQFLTQSPNVTSTSLYNLKK